MSEWAVRYGTYFIFLFHLQVCFGHLVFFYIFCLVFVSCLVIFCILGSIFGGLKDGMWPYGQLAGIHGGTTDGNND